MIFWTIIFIVYYLAVITRGTLFYDTIKKGQELFLEQSRIESKLEKDRIGKEILKNSWKMFLLFPLVIAMYTYLFKAITIDPYKFPSIIILFYLLLTTFVIKDNRKPKTDLTTEEGRIRFKIECEKKKRYSFKGFIKQIIFLSYFCYMFYILMF